MKFLTSTINGLGDDAAAIVLIIAPFVLGLKEQSVIAHWASIAGGVGLIASLDTPMAARIGVGAVLEELAGSPSLRATIEPLRQLLRADAPQIRADACHYLGLTGDRRIIADIEPLLDDPDPEVRVSAAYFFGRFPQAGAWSPRVARVRQALDGYAAGDRARIHLVKDLDGMRAHVQRAPDWAAALVTPDDRMVILAPGDELRMQFDASDLPAPPAGWSRTAFLESLGWDKDADRNTYAAQQLEPLPFRAMSGYPYGPDEAYPDTPLHREYRARWLTRVVGGGSAGVGRVAKNAATE